jgi:hypothetical protein
LTRKKENLYPDNNNMYDPDRQTYKQTYQKTRRPEEEGE